MEAKGWRLEQERLDQVREKLKARIDVLEPEVSGLSDQAAEIRRRFWEEVTVNTSTDEEFEETFYTIKQQAAVLSERERRHRLLVQQWRSFNRMLPSPYFGRVDFLEDGLNGSEQIYIGVSSFVDEDGLTFLVYDWRSPIASLYYDHSPGSAFYETPVGRITGTMEQKRQYQIQDGQLRRMFDASVTIGDELLQQMLAKGADSQMKSIVSPSRRSKMPSSGTITAGCLSCRVQLEAGRPPRLYSVWRTCCTKTAIRLRQIRSFYSRQTRCLTAMYPPSFPSLARRICSRRLFRNILNIGSVHPSKWRIPSVRSNMC